MIINPRQLLRVFVITLIGTITARPEPYSNFESKDYPADNTISRDFCIIGGGSAGTYVAIALKKRGKSVIVIEKEDRLGGHVNTYTDPATGYKYDYGVVIFANTKIVKRYFAHFNISVREGQYDFGGTPQTVDFSTGNLVNLTLPNFNESLAAYGMLLDKYPYLEDGWNLPKPIPADLLLPFSKVVEKYNLRDALNFITLVTQGSGNILKSTTVYQLKYFYKAIFDDLTKGYVIPVAHDNSLLYELALKQLNSDNSVLLNSMAVASSRPIASSSEPIQLIAKTFTNNTLSSTLLNCQSGLVVAIPQLLSNMQVIGPDDREAELFSKFKHNYYWTALLNNTGLPENSTFINTGEHTPYNLPSVPGSYEIGSTPISGIFNIFYGSAMPLPDSVVQDAIVDDILRLRALAQREGLVPGGVDDCKPEFVEFKQHNPYLLHVPVEDIEKGFYDEMNALQGYRRTWYTGAALSAEDSGAVWRFSEELVTQIVAKEGE